LRIKIEIDEQNRILTIKDNGIGMTKEDVIQNIGSIARSETKFRRLTNHKIKKVLQ